MRVGLKRTITVLFVFLFGAGLLGCTLRPRTAGAGEESSVAGSKGVEAGGGASTSLPAGPKNDALDPEEGDVERGFTAHFEALGGSPVADRLVSVIETEPETSRQNFIFAGWYLDAEYSGTRVVFPYRLTDHTTFYAKWLSEATVIITDAESLQEIQTQEAWAGNYALGNDIDLTGVDFEPIGDRLNPFSGTFDGNGFSVSGLYLEPKEEDPEYNRISVGLFGHVTGKISNLNVVDFVVELDGGFSRFYVGGVAGWVEGGSLTNCYARGRINNPEVEYEGDIWDDFFGSYAEPTELTDFGVLVGFTDEGSSLSHCRAEGSIVSKTVTSTVYGGGLTGRNEYGSEIDQCFAHVRIEARMAGGLVGYNNGTVRNSYATGDANGSLAYPAIAGGLIGFNDVYGVVSRAYATGRVSARTAGGLIGVNMFDYLDLVGGSVINCYASGAVVASEYGGGLIGRAEAQLPINGEPDYHESITSDYYFIGYCFAYGDVTVDVRDVYYSEGQSTQGVYHSVFAGGLIGHATEPLVRSAIAFGDVSATSMRPVSGTDTQVYNSVFANNFIGQSTSLLSNSRNVYVVDEQEVLRNGSLYASDFNSAPKRSYLEMNALSFLSNTMGFEAAIWNLNNIDFEAGRIPTLRL